jgi:predicted nucleic acid-binding protein
LGRRPRIDAQGARAFALIVADTSAWVELLRGSDHPAAVALERLIRDSAEVAVTEVVVMELLSGVRPGAPARELRSRLLSFPILTLGGLGDFEEAAAIYRACRAAGHALRGLTDCLIAVPVIRERAALLHNDQDFEVIARHTGLRTQPVSAS